MLHRLSEVSLECDSASRHAHLSLLTGILKRTKDVIGLNILTNRWDVIKRLIFLDCPAITEIGLGNDSESLSTGMMTGRYLSALTQCSILRVGQSISPIGHSDRPRVCCTILQPLGG